MYIIPTNSDWAVVVPMANEEKEFAPFIEALTHVLDQLKSGKVYLITDKVSKDKTPELCNLLASQDFRFVHVWAPNNKNVTEAYLKGYWEALNGNHQLILEMDAGLSHDPNQIPHLIAALEKGNECAFGSRFMKGNSHMESNFMRYFLSKGGTILANFLLGTRFKDMTSGFQGFRQEVVAVFVTYKFHSIAHFYQSELRYLLRKRKYIEIPVSYKAPSPNVSTVSFFNSIYVLFYYFCRRLIFKKDSI